MKKLTKLILGVLVLATIFVWAQIAQSPSADVVDKNVHIYFLDVGQGDSELIQAGNVQIMIDGGPDDSVLSQIGTVMPVSDRKIETLVLTHPHADHLVGLNSILDRYEIGQIYYSGAIYDSNGYEEFLDKANAKNIPLKVPKIGQTENFFIDGELTFLWPGEKYKDRKIDNLNNVSEVTRFCYLNRCALFTGDIETDEQAAMLSICHSEAKTEESQRSFADAQDDNTCGIFQSEILKLSHHGSSNGTNQELLSAVKPKYAVAEVGANNKYGHPHALVLDLLQKSNIQIYRTDREGMIEFVLSSEGVTKK